MHDKSCIQKVLTNLLVSFIGFVDSTKNITKQLVHFWSA
jgi:hypothetical protein